MTLSEEWKAQQRNTNIEMAKARWGDNHWWQSDDPRTRAYYQMQEPILLLESGVFRGDIKALLGRPVYTHEFAVHWAELLQEAEAAWKGTPFSEEGKQHVIETSIQKLKNPIIILVPENGP